MRKKRQMILWLAVGVWLAVAIYGLIFNITYIDEAKYLIKGWLILTGKISYYQTPEFFYQHMPGIFLWYGLGQKIFGPSLLVGRLQSLLIGLLVFGSSFLLGKRLTGQKGGIITLAILSLAPVTALYYSTAVPQSLVVLVLILGFICLYDGLVLKSNFKLLLASVFFSLAFIVRENFLFTLILYCGFLLIILRKKLKFFGWQAAVIGLTLGVFLIPGYPGTIEVLRNFPGVSQLLPVSQAEKEVLGLYWKEGLFGFSLYLRAIKEFGIIFHAWILIWSLIVFRWFREGKRQIQLNEKPKQLFWLFLITVSGFNFLVHDWAAFRLSPRAIVSYFSYIAPLVAVMMSTIIARWLKTIKTQQKAMIIYLFLLILSPIGLRFAAIFAIPTRLPDLRDTYESALKLKQIIKNKEKILWLGEPMSLYLAGKVSFYPLINHTGFYKPSADTKTVKRLGFWNLELLQQWFNEANLVMVEENKLKLLRESTEGTKVADFIDEILTNQFQLLGQRDDIWPGGLIFYETKK